MRKLSNIRNIVFASALCFLSGCSAQYIFCHPQNEQKDLVFAEHIAKKPVIIEERMSLRQNGKEIPPGANLEGKIKLDSYQFYNRFYSRLNQRSSERIHVDLQESKVRDYCFLSDSTQYGVFVRGSQFSKNNYHGDEKENEFNADFYNEIQKLTSKALRDSLKDLDIYEILRPFIEFDIRRDPIPFTNKKVVDTIKEKDENLTNKIDSMDEFDERLVNPHKVPKQELSEDWITDRLTNISLGLNLNYDLFKSGGDLAIEPYIKWMDVFRWTYYTKNYTIEHKLSLPIYHAGFGFSAETNQTCDQLNKMDASFSYAVDRLGVFSISAFKKFFDSDTNLVSEDEGISIGVYLKF